MSPPPPPHLDHLLPLPLLPHCRCRQAAATTAKLPPPRCRRVQFFVLEIYWSYLHSSNCHLCYGEVRILVSPPFFISLFSIVQTFSSNLFIFYAECSFEAMITEVQDSYSYAKGRPSSTSVDEVQDSSTEVQDSLPFKEILFYFYKTSVL
jgi:hypothetical protein